MERELAGIWALSEPMKAALRRLLRDPSSSIEQRTERALATRGLLADDGLLTRAGWEHAIEHLPLDEQCTTMGLPLVVHSVPGLPKRPEQAVIQMLSTQGVDAYYTENTFGVHVPQFLAYPVTREVELAAGAQLYSLSPLSLADEAGVLRRAAAQATVLFNMDVVRHTYGEVDTRRRSDEPFYTDLWPLEFYEMLVSRLEPKTMGALVDLVGSNPTVLRSGWPDLLCFGDSRAFFVEVKTTDRFHLSQIRTVSRLEGTGCIPTECWQLITEHSVHCRTT